jgi:hypothetical protein
VYTTTTASTRPGGSEPPRTGRSRAATAWLGLVLAALSAGCIGGAPDCAELPTEIELTLTADSLTPSDPAVCRGVDVELVVGSDVEGILHIHGYDAEVPATPVTAGGEVVIDFTASRSGQFPIELHTDENTQGVNVGLLTVHEP